MGKELSTQESLNSYELSNNKSNIYFWLHQILDGVKITKFATFENLVNAVYSLLSDAFTPETPETAIIGEGKIWFGLTAPSKWLLVNGETIGNLSSGADHAAEGYEDIFIFLWENHADTSCPVSGGRGASAAADFAAGKTLTLPNACGRAPIGAGQGEGLTNRSLGGQLGEENHIISSDEGYSHTHTGTSHTHTLSHTHIGGAHSHQQRYLVTGLLYRTTPSGSNKGLGSDYATAGDTPLTTSSDGDVVTSGASTNTTSASGTGNTGSSGGGAAHNNMPPSLIVNFIIYTGE